MSNEASARQVQAARPDASTWLAANAGSGKTRVLTDRVARLLMEGVEPQRILCLTYTKAAASEMQNRLFARLGAWAMLADADLRDALGELGVPGPLDAGRLSRARTLFARAIETPGGLKIQTIHSFCASLLRRFPLEAGVSPQFTEIEDRAAALLRAEIIEDMAAGAHLDVVAAVAPMAHGDDIGALAAAICGRAEAFAAARSPAELRQALGCPEDLTREELLSRTLLPDDLAMIGDLCTALSRGSVNDVKAAEQLSAVSGGFDCLAVLEQALLNGKGAKEPFTAKIGKFPTKATRDACAALMPSLEDLMRRVESGRPLRLGLLAAEKAEALHAFAAAFLPEYTRRKQLRGWLDFDDLIQKARHLLGDPAVAAWVLFRLDGGIDHILVDEAQDTSPAQWDVIEKLAQEFTAGEGARPDVVRTIFVVGDKKQSIYSFQGADPDAFDRMQAQFGRRLSAVGEHLQDLTLDYSFRSAHAILRLVDLVFEGQEAAGFPQGGKHLAFHDDLPGRVDLWPVVPKTDNKDEETGNWYDPVDRPAAQRPEVILADRVAARIRQMIETGETIPEKRGGALLRRPITPGDVLILVQRRSALFSELIRACKAAGLPIAGADRLKVGAELAVKDLAALLRFLALPEDSLSLACALRSPLFGWSEQDLFTLAHGRKGHLWQALYRRREEHAETFAVLADLRGQTDLLRPYDLIERILTRHDGRRKLLARLGREAEDGIDALLSQALAYERTEVPSLTGFLVWMETDDLEIKRQVGQGSDLIRVMTVHGAKGLEAPIVILPDTAHRPERAESGLLELDGLPIPVLRADEQPDAVRDAVEAARDRRRRERQRLLYVALTRAECWLIAAAAGETGKDGSDWYSQVAGAMQRAGAVDLPVGDEVGLRLEEGDWDGAPLVAARAAPVDAAAEVPDWARLPAPPPAARPETLSPSDLGGAKALAGVDGLDEAAAMARGTAIHRLLELLPAVPPSDRAAAARRILGEAADAGAIAEALAVLDRAELAALFAPGTLAEVAVSAPLGHARLHGAIDRLIVEPDRVLAVDFKTNAEVPARPRDVPDGLLRQMGAYAEALAALYPERRIETAILWTRTAQLMPLPAPLLREALRQAGRLDAALAAT